MSGIEWGRLSVLGWFAGFLSMCPRERGMYCSSTKPKVRMPLHIGTCLKLNMSCSREEVLASFKERVRAKHAAVGCMCT
jgi:hypothetical protein